MNKFTFNNNNRKLKTDCHHSTFSKVIRFGSDLFSPLLLPPTCFSPTINTSTAINPQDVILNRKLDLLSPSQLTKLFSIHQQYDETINQQLPKAKTVTKDNNTSEIPFGNALTISPSGYIETVRSPYSNFSDVFFDVSSENMMFSIESNSCDSSNSCNRNKISGCSTTTNEEPISSCILPPSSAILQSELDNSSLDYFISNNSFIEEIKSSLSVEQQQYINSGITNLSSTNSCTTNTPSTKESYDLITSIYSDDLTFNQPDLTAYNYMFGNDDCEEFSCQSLSPDTNYYSLDENTDVIMKGDTDGSEDDEEEDEEYSKYKDHNIYSTEDSGTRFNPLLMKSDGLNNDKDHLFDYNSHDNNNNNAIGDVKTRYSSEINDAFIYNNQPSLNASGEGEKSDVKLTELHTSNMKAYKKVYSVDDKLSRSHEDGYTVDNKVQVKQQSSFMTNKKRKINQAEENIKNDISKKKATKKSFYNDEDNYSNINIGSGKKSRKNYNADTINALMDWYLKNNGKAPASEPRHMLAEITGKSDVQISTWFQNARRRHQNKLKQFQSLSSLYPTLVYNHQTLKSYLKSNKP